MSPHDAPEPRLEPLLQAFDRVWQAGKAPRLGDFLNSPAARQLDAGGRRVLLRELIAIDIERRWRTHQAANGSVTAQSPTASASITDAFPDRPLLEDYACRWPELRSGDQLPMELIAVEYGVRRHWGDRPLLSEYQARFPDRSGEVRAALAQVDRELAAEFADPAPAAPDATGAISADARLVKCSNCGHHFGASEQEIASCPACGKGVVLETAASSARPPVSRVGRYRLGERLGAGAFGSVWQAWDEELQREVALKLPRHQLLGEDEERFLREARAAAGLRHEGIVPVYDAGREGGTHYIVSALVRGPSLAQWLDAQRPSFRQAAELVAQVADALEYAHQQGVIHRDLKPANILLSGVRRQEAGVRRQETGGRNHESGVNGDHTRLSSVTPDSCLLTPVLADFGLAKRAGGEVTMTLDGHLLGTPAYMSPEQVQDAHGADARSDVYSLGVILYQMLTGELPFVGVAAMVLEQVLKDEPRRPRRLNGTIPLDLETIALKCMEKEPARRYGSAAELAEELRRWLGGEPIRARPPGALGRLRRWASRKPIVAGLVATVFLMLGLLAVGSIVAVVNITRERNEARAARLETEEKNRQLAAALRDAREKEEQVAREQNQVLQSLNTLITLADQRLSRMPNTQKVREEVLLRAIAELDRIARASEKSGTQPATYLAYKAMGDVLLSLGRTPEALERYKHAMAIVEELAKSGPQPGVHRLELAPLGVRLGELYLELGNRRAAQEQFERIRQQEEAFLKSHPQDLHARRSLAAAHARLADTLARTEQDAVAWKHARECHEGLEALAKLDPVGTQLDLARAYHRFGRWNVVSNPQEALTWYKKAEPCLKNMLAANSTDPRAVRELAEARRDMAGAHRQLGKWEEADKLYQECLTLCTALVRIEPYDAQTWRTLAVAHLQIGAWKLQRGDPEGARVSLETAVRILKQMAASDPRNFHLKSVLAVALAELGNLHMHLGEPNHADELIRSVRLREELLASDPKNLQFQAEVSLACLRAAMYYQRLRQYQEAIPWHERSLKIYREVASRIPFPTSDGQPADAGVANQIEQAIAVCREAPRAMEDGKHALNHPGPLAAQLLSVRAADLATHGRRAEVAEIAEQLNNFAPRDSGTQFAVACCYSLCLVAEPVPAEQQAAQDRYRTAALEALQRAVDLGFKDLAQITSDPDLRGIRDQPAYCALVEKLKKGP